MKVGDSTKIWQPSNVYGCEIGENCMVGAFTEIQSDVKIGDNVRIQSHTFVCSLVTIENNVFVGHGVMFINDKHPPSGNPQKWQKTIVKEGASIGSNATILPAVIGRNSVVGAGAVVTHDVPENGIAVGVPAKVVGFRKVCEHCGKDIEGACHETRDVNNEDIRLYHQDCYKLVFDEKLNKEVA